MQQPKYPPYADDVEKLAEFFDQADTSVLEGVEEVADVPDRDA